MQPLLILLDKQIADFPYQYTGQQHRQAVYTCGGKSQPLLTHFDNQIAHSGVRAMQYVQSIVYARAAAWISCWPVYWYGRVSCWADNCALRTIIVHSIYCLTKKRHHLCCLDTKYVGLHPSMLRRTLVLSCEHSDWSTRRPWNEKV